MSFFLTSMKKDLARWRHDAAAIALWISIPLMIGGLITLMMDGGDGAKPNGILLIADEDDTLLSGFVAGAYSQGELGELITVQKVSVEAGTAKIEAGDASGFLIIPQGFSEAFFESKPVTLTLKTNPSQSILPGIITNVTETLLDVGFYAEQLFGDEIQQMTSATDSVVTDDVLVASIAVAFQQKMDALGPHFFPPIIDLEIVAPPAEEPGVPMALLFLPGIIFMAIMFSANGLASDYWKERGHGTLRRLMYAPAQQFGFVAGKAAAAAVAIAMIGGLTLGIGFVYHGLMWVNFLPSLIWVALSGVALFAWFSVLQMISKNQSAGNLVTSLVLFPMLMAGGSFFPFAALPDRIAAIGRRTPNGFMVDRLTTEITTAGAWSIDIQSWLIVIAMAAGGLGICVWRLQSGFARR